MIARLCRASRQGVWFRVLCGELHTHNTFRDEDSLLSCKDTLCYYMDNGSWLFIILVLISLCSND